MHTSRERKGLVLFLLLLCPSIGRAQSNWTLLGWNNLGMHCMDSDYSVFSILPPYNTIHAQLINQQGRLVTNATGIGVTYQAICDPTGSFNSTSRGKCNFWEHSFDLFSNTPPQDTGLPVPGPEAYAMPGTSNAPQPMAFEASHNWFAAYGVPITPYDDAGKPNQYPLMRLKATNSLGAVLAMTDIVLPVSDEMDCKLCHLSGSGAAAQPAAGWIWDSNPGRDYRLNILRLHDELQMTNAEYAAALVTAGFNTNGLFSTVTVNGRAVLCAACHLSEALPDSGKDGISPLTAAMHGGHAPVLDPRNGLALDSESNRLACYSCHPGSVTRCLRGAMGRAVSTNGAMAMQCQSCHGSLSMVGSTNRTGWYDEPNCQACHVGSATNSFATIRFLSALTSGVLRVPAETMFATTPNTPIPTSSLYRFSTGHGGLQCAACHGSTHAEFPSAFRNDNIGGFQHQGHAGFMSDCAVCHKTSPATTSGGPHRMHPNTSNWVADHHDSAGSSCRACHGATSRGTELSQSFGDKTFSTTFGSKYFWRGYQVSCYTCHDGPSSGDTTTRGFPVVTNRTAVTTSGVAVAISLGGSGLRIVDQAGHGAVGLAGSTATYTSESLFIGTDTFTFAANNGYNDSNLGMVTVLVYAAANPTNPAVPASLVALTAYPASNTIGIASTLGESYRLQRTDHLLLHPWSNVAGVFWGRTDYMQVSDTNVPLGDVAFYRTVSGVDDGLPDVLAQDSATNTAYDAGWSNGSSGGGGWGGAWQLSPVGSTNAGHFIGTTGQANMSLPPRAWGLWAKNGSVAEAVRPFAQALQPGDSLVFRFDNNYIITNSSAGFGLQNAAGTNLFEFYFPGGDTVYVINDRVAGRRTLIPWSGGGWDITFQLVHSNEYILAAGPYQVSGILKAVADRTITRFRTWNYNAGSTWEYDLFLNDMMILRP